MIFPMKMLQRRKKPSFQKQKNLYPNDLNVQLVSCFIYKMILLFHFSIKPLAYTGFFNIVKISFLSWLKDGEVETRSENRKISIIYFTFLLLRWCCLIDEIVKNSSQFDSILNAILISFYCFYSFQKNNVRISDIIVSCCFFLVFVRIHNRLHVSAHLSHIKWLQFSLLHISRWNK